MNDNTTYKLSYDGDKIDETLQLTNDKTKGNEALKVQSDNNATKLSEISSTVANHESELKTIDSALAEISSTVANHESELKTIDSALVDEITARQNADSTLQSNIDKKQDKLTAGDDITIENNVISSTGGNSLKLYKHTITFQCYTSITTVTSNTVSYRIVVIDTQSTPYTVDTLDPLRIVSGTRQYSASIGSTGSGSVPNSQILVWGWTSGTQYMYFTAFPILDSTGTYYNAAPSNLTLQRIAKGLLYFNDKIVDLN